MTMQQQTHLRWILGYSQRRIGRVPNTHIATYILSDLIKTGHLDRAEAHSFLTESGLRDFRWEVTWYADFDTPDELLLQTISDVQGYVIWIHGWTGNLHIWENLPGMVVNSNTQLVSIAIDHNGFGSSVFDDDTPHLDRCNPPAAMHTLKQFIELIKIRRQPGQHGHKVINLVGHSMGAAMLFYLNPLQWNFGEVTRFAVAPALLLEDESHRAFYQTLGLGIGILQHLPVLEVFERFLKPSVLRTLLSGASDEVKEIHDRQYNETPRGITGATFMAMGRLKNYEIARDFDLMQVMLGHRDPLVGLVSMIDLLGNLEYPAANIHVVPGTHYLFSVGTESPTNAYHHAQAREMLVTDIMSLHQHALEKQKVGPRYG